MKSVNISASALIAALLASVTLAHAENSLPGDEDKEGWNRLIDQFAECSAVYNLAATLTEAPKQGDATYRELANNALVAGVFSAERVGLKDNYLESIYSVKYAQWEKLAKDRAQNAKLLARAEKCINDTLAVQKEVVGSLRGKAAGK